MKNGQMFIGSGEDFQGGLTELTEDDLTRQHDRNIIPRFFIRNVKTEDGFQQREYLQLLIPGDAKSSPEHLVDDRLRKRFAKNYQAFKEGRELPVDGTAIEHWLGADDHMTLLLRSMHLRTVEHVAEMTDTVKSAIGLGGGELQKRARAYLDIQKDVKKADESVAKDNVIADLMNRLRKLEKGKHAASEEDDDDSPVGNLVPAGAHLVSPVKEKNKKSGKGGR